MVDNYGLGNKFIQRIIPEYVPSQAELQPPIFIYGNMHPLQADFNVKKLNKVLQSQTKDMSPGTDGVTYSTIKTFIK